MVPVRSVLTGLGLEPTPVTLQLCDFEQIMLLQFPCAYNRSYATCVKESQ